METLLQTELNLIERINNLRAIHRLINTLDFKIAYERCSVEQQQYVLSLITNNDKTSLISWLSKEQHRYLELEDLSIREMRKLAQQLGIRGYLNMTKSLLLSVLYQRVNNVNTSVVKTN